MKNLTLTVSQFNTFVKNILDAEEFLFDVQIVGEVSNFKLSGGHAYFDLKDDGALLSCVKFGAGYLHLDSGARVTVCGRVNFYVKSGRLNFVVNKIDLYGLGALYQKFLELKSKLESAGYFREELKKPIPKYAQKIGVVTSPTGAVIRDIIHVTRSKNPYTDIIVYPSKVQGFGAEEEIAAGIKYFNSREDIDTIIVARGGGSLEDLSAFNTERVVLAIFDSEKPVISAVGHETDFSLCDFAADLRVPTPSVAAEVAVFDYFAERELVCQIESYISYAAARNLKLSREKLSQISNGLIDKLSLKLSASRSELKENLGKIQSQISLVVAKKRSALDILMTALSKQNPLEILKTGYAVVECEGRRVNKVSQVKNNSEIKLRLADGEIIADVREIKGDNHEV